MQREWFQNPRWWFSVNGDQPAIDAEVCARFSHLLGCHDENKLELILRYDQLPRHVFRGEPCAHVLDFFSRKAAAVTDTINFDDRNIDESLVNAELVFALLPWRHVQDPSKIFEACKIVWKRLAILKEKGEKDERQLLHKFLRASYSRCPIVGIDLDLEDDDKDSLGAHNLKTELFDDILDEECTWTSNDVMMSSKLDLDKVGLTQRQNINFLPFTKSKKTSGPLVLSISGGVDSMVCSVVLLRQVVEMKTEQDKKDFQKRITVVHINYCNRATSDREAELVRWWSSQLGMKCFVRRIHEIQRRPCMEAGLRDVYEMYTRKVRFQCYKKFGPEATIVLGHNKDDVLENIMTNVANKSKYDNLDGMTPFSTSDGISFWRPMLRIAKDDIVGFARENHIPYLPCSTPKWSQRGQIREKVLPTLKGWFSDFENSLHGLSVMMQEMHEMASSQVEKVQVVVGYDDDDKMKKMKKKITTLRFTEGKLPTAACFWKLMFRRLNMEVSARSLQNMLGRLTAALYTTKSHHVKVVLSRRYTLTAVFGNSSADGIFCPSCDVEEM